MNLHLQCRFSCIDYGTNDLRRTFTSTLEQDCFIYHVYYRALFRSPESLNTLNSWVWISGMVERETNTLLIYPVPDMSEDTVVPIIERHVEAWSTIYNGGWSAYCGLNELGYNHSTVLHKHSFKKVYIYQKTREEVEIHTNRIEGAWKHAKDHFRRMSGTKISRFEGHLCEIMWRAETKIKYLLELLLVPQHN